MLQSMGSQRFGHNLPAEQQRQHCRLLLGPRPLGNSREQNLPPPMYYVIRSSEGGRPEVTRKRKPREAFAAPQPLCNGHGWGHCFCLVLEAHPAYSSILRLWSRPLHLGSKENQGSQRWLFNLCCGMDWKV